MWILFIILCLITFVYAFIKTRYKHWKRMGIEQVEPTFLFGNLGPLFFKEKSLAEVMLDLYRSYPDERYCGAYVFLTPTLVLKDLELIKKITIKEFDTFPEHRAPISEDIDPLFANNLFFMRGGEMWHEMRTTLSPAFSANKLKIMYGLMEDCAVQFVDFFEKRGTSVEVEMKDAFTRYTNDVIGTTAFGVTCNSLEHPENEFYLMGKAAVHFDFVRSLKFFINAINPVIMEILRLPILPNHVRDFVRSLITKTLRYREAHGIVRPDMIHLLMEARNEKSRQDEQLGKGPSPKRTKRKFEISDEDIAAQALIFFLAGFDTAATAMCFVSYELALNPEVQGKLREEIDSIPTDHITYEDLTKLKYLDMVVSETLRKWPPAFFTDRQSVRPYTIEPENRHEKPLHLPKGAVCWIPIMGIHRDPKYYQNPDRFDPERFSDENKENIQPFSYMPFGLGPKNCIGMRFALLEVKLIVFKILKKFEIVPIEKTPTPLVLSKEGFFLVAEGGFWLGLKRRRGN